MSHTKQFDCRKGLDVDKLAGEIEAFLNDEEVIKDPDLSASILLPPEYAVGDVKLDFAARSTKAGILEVLNTMFAEPQVIMPDLEPAVVAPVAEETVPAEVESGPEETPAEAAPEAETKKGKKKKTDA